MKESNGIEIVVPEEMWETKIGKKAKRDADKIIKSIEEHQKAVLTKLREKNEQNKTS